MRPRVAGERVRVGAGAGAGIMRARGRARTPRETRERAGAGPAGPGVVVRFRAGGACSFGRFGRGEPRAYIAGGSVRVGGRVRTLILLGEGVKCYVKVC